MAIHLLSLSTQDKWRVTTNTVTKLHTGRHQLHVQIGIHGTQYMSYTCYDSFQAINAVVRTGSDGL